MSPDHLLPPYRVDWWNNRRLHSACADIPPVEFETLYYTQQATVPAA